MFGRRGPEFNTIKSLLSLNSMRRNIEEEEDDDREEAEDGSSTLLVSQLSIFAGLSLLVTIAMLYRLLSQGDVDQIHLNLQ